MRNNCATHFDILGAKFGRWTVLKRMANKYTHPMMLCRCDCGTEKEVKLPSLREGLSKSCGCLRDELSKVRVRTHGQTRTNTYRAWRSAKTRCGNPNNEKFPIYGGRGISMCPRWANDFSKFLLDMGKCPAGLSLERKDVDGNYEPGNCKWATRKEQANNTRTNIFVTLNGVRMTLHQCADSAGVDYHSFHHFHRVRKFPVGEAIILAAKI